MLVGITIGVLSVDTSQHHHWLPETIDKLNGSKTYIVIYTTFKPILVAPGTVNRVLSRTFC